MVQEGDEAFVVLDRTPLYAEGGGQVGDRGWIRARSGEAEVLDTQKLVSDLIGHRVRVVSGELAVGDDVEAVVDHEFRRGTERAHTATHILHWILRDRLGDHARQAGSLVEPGRLRFDFSHFEAVTPDQLGDISQELQARVSVDDGVRAYETSYDFARSIGAMAIFGEKYGDFVRVVEVGEYSKELCGGTHVPHTSSIGAAVLTSEGSVGANLRRVEALVGAEGIAYLRHRAGELQRAAELLKVGPDEVGERIERLLATQKDMERKLAEVQKTSAEADATALAEEAVDVDGTRLVVGRRDIGVDDLRALAQKLKSVLGSAVVVLGTAGEGKANLVAAVTKDVAARGISARDLLAAGSLLLGGGAGASPSSPSREARRRIVYRKPSRRSSARRPRRAHRRMILGIDPGSRRTGIAVADLETRFARPLEVIDAKSMDPVERIGHIVGEMGVTRVVVGRPTSLSGAAGPAVRVQEDFLTRLRAALDVPVSEFDERLTTVIAERALKAAGGKRAARNALKDAVAAQVMLQDYLDSGQ